MEQVQPGGEAAGAPPPPGGPLPLERPRRTVARRVLATLALLFGSLLTLLAGFELAAQLWFGTGELRTAYNWWVGTHLLEMPYADFVRRQERIQAVRARLSMERAESHALYEFTYNPGFRIDLPEDGLEFHVNSHGLRGEEFPAEKPPDEFRVMCLGASTVGEEVGEADTYPAQLERLLQAEFPDRHVRVINAGIPSYDVRRSFTMYALRLRRFAPDVVTIYHGINDLLYQGLGVGPEIASRRNYNGRLVGPHAWQGDAATESLLVEEVRPLLRRSHVMLFVRELVRRWKEWRGEARWTAPDPQGMELFAAYYEALVAMIRASGAVPVPMTFAVAWPGHFDAGDQAKVEASFRECLHAIGMPLGTGRQTIDAMNGVARTIAGREHLSLADVAASVPPDREHFLDVCHLRPAGNRRIAETMAATIAPLIARPHPHDPTTSEGRERRVHRHHG